MSRQPAPLQTFRLTDGGLIDRNAALSFTFDGKAYMGHPGDTLASALLANGVHLVGRSFKYHRPRGIFTDGSHEPNALLTLHEGAATDPNAKAPTVELCDGLIARSQNRWPSLSCDLMAVNSLFSPLFVAGFYYKTFMWPKAFWEKLYEPLIRRAAGLGALSGLPDPDAYEKSHAFCDILIIGAGPAGLMAARTAAETGLRVILCTDDTRTGGRLLSERHTVDGSIGADWAARITAELAAFPNVRLMTRTTVFGLYDGPTFAALERVGDCVPDAPAGAPRQRYWKIAARHAILATGATERPLPFGGNDRPGVMLASAVRGYANRTAVRVGQQVAVYTTNDAGWATAADLARLGIQVTAMIDVREQVPDAVTGPVRSADVPCLLGTTVARTFGRQRVKAIEVVDASGHRRRIPCDVLAVSGGWNPVIALGCGLSHRPVWQADAGAYLLDNGPAHLTPAGAAAGRASLHAALGDGIRAGQTAASALGASPPGISLPQAEDEPASGALFFQTETVRGKAFVDLQHDVTVADIALATREGYTSVEHLKRYTTLGMGTDQGRTANVTGNALLAAATGQAMAEAGTVLARPPVVPVPVAAFAAEHRGTHFRPARRTASHDWAAARGAVFTNAGLWKRAQWFPLPGETHWRQSVDREVTAVRTNVGVCDVSTLGKVDVQGADAGTFLDRLYINTFSTLPVGKARYGVMLREDGFVMDDGTTARLAEHHYILTTTTANAGPVMQHLEYCRSVLWPDLDVALTSVTEQWAQYAVAGPNARTVMQALLGDTLDLSNDAFPFMAAAETRWRGGAARIFRLSFSGELAFEIAVPAHMGGAMIEAIMDAGADWGITPYGTEALSVLRIEKGHVAGAELNGQTTAPDLGLARMMSTKKDYIGRPLAARPALTDPARPTLVGLKPVNPADTVSGGAHLLPVGAPLAAAHDQGYVTSVAHSPTLGHAIALGFLKHGPERIGQQICAVDPVRGRTVVMEVCPPTFVDPKGARLHV